MKTATLLALRRLNAITESKRVYEAFGPVQHISSIQQVGPEKYQVTSDKCLLEVRVEAVRPDYNEPSRILPPLRVELGRMTCLP